MILTSLGINEHKLMTTDKNNTNHQVFSQMEENFEVFLRKYTLRKASHCLHIIEAWVILLTFALNDAKFRTRRGAKSKHKNNIFMMLSSINEDRLVRYICLILKNRKIDWLPI